MDLSDLRDQGLLGALAIRRPGRVLGAPPIERLAADTCRDGKAKTKKDPRLAWEWTISMGDLVVYQRRTQAQS